MEENNSASGEPPTRRSLRDAEAARLAAEAAAQPDAGAGAAAQPSAGVGAASDGAFDWPAAFGASAAQPAGDTGTPVGASNAGNQGNAGGAGNAANTGSPGEADDIDDVDLIVAGFAAPRSADGTAGDAAPLSSNLASGDAGGGSGHAGPGDGAGAKHAPPRSVVRSVIGVAGELLITAGVLVFLFLGWQLWIQGIALNAAQTNEASGLSQQWSAPTVGPTTADATPGATAAPAGTGSTPLVMAAPSETTQFAVLYVPRFGADYKRTVAQGVDAKTVLNAGGAGHYETSQMPGDMGNFAIAAHRDGWGSPFIKINELQVGDPIYVETQDGWYTYRFRDLEYVSPDGVDVLSAVPQAPDASPTDRLITLTSCNPLYIASERIIAYGVLESFAPRSAGAPAEIAGLSGKGA